MLKKLISAKLISPKLINVSKRTVDGFGWVRDKFVVVDPHTHPSREIFHCSNVQLII